MIQNKEGTVGKSLLGQERFNKKEHKTQRHTQPELQRQRTHTYCAATETHSNTRSCTLSAHTHRKKHTLTHRDKKNDTHAGRNIHNDENTEKDESTHTHTHLWSIKHCTSWSYINGKRTTELASCWPGCQWQQCFGGWSSESAVSCKSMMGYHHALHHR